MKIGTAGVEITDRFDLAQDKLFGCFLASTSSGALHVAFARLSLSSWSSSRFNKGVSPPLMSWPLLYGTHGMPNRERAKIDKENAVFDRAFQIVDAISLSGFPL